MVRSKCVSSHCYCGYSFIFTFFFKLFIDNVSHSNQDQSTAIIGSLALYIGTLLLLRISGDFRTAAFGFFEQNLQRSLAIAAMTSISSQTLEKNAREKVGSVMSTIERGLGAARGLAFEFINVIFIYALQLILSAIILIYHFQHWYIFLALMMFVFSLGLIPLVLRQLNPMQREAMASYTKAQGYLSDLMINYETVKVYNLQKTFTQLYDKDLETSVNAWNRFHYKRIQWSIAQYALMVSGIFVALISSVYMFWSGQYTVGDIVMLDMYLLNIVRPFDSIGFAVRQIQRSRLAIDGLLNILLSRRVDLKNETTEIDAKHNNVVLVKNLSLSLSRTQKSTPSEVSNERMALQEVSLRVIKGEVIALVGSSGSGKTSILRILSGLYRDYNGSVEIFGQEARHIPMQKLSQSVAYVGQDAQVFNESLHFNLTLGKGDISEEQVSRVASLMHLDELLSRLPNGYSTILGERGAKLSGGERQRIALARAFLKNAQIFLLDEATSALDYSTESMVLANIRTFLSGKTLIMTAHRLSSIVDVSRIYLIENGTVLECGEHQSLLSKGGGYARLWESQKESNR